jgi:hypothetical protein
MEDTCSGNFAQKCNKLSWVSSDSGNFYQDYDAPRNGIVVDKEELENLVGFVRNALDKKGKNFEGNYGLFENLKGIVRVLCQDYLKDEIEEGGRMEDRNKDVWEKIFGNWENGCFLNGDECRDVGLVLTGLIRESGLSDLESKIRKLQENVVSCKIKIFNFSTVLKKCLEKSDENQEIIKLVSDIPADCLISESITSASRKLELKPTTIIQIQ